MIAARASRGAPLDPSGDAGHDQLQRELLHPEYHRQDVLQQIVDWVQRHLRSGLDAAHDAPPLSTLAAMVVFVVLLAALAALVSRARRTATAPGASGAVLTEEVVTAAELRARAHAARDAGRYADAVVEGFRALTLQQVERGLLADAPGATAREVATALAAERPDVGTRVAQAAERFDAARYGDRPASRAEAEQVLALDDELAGARRAGRR